MKKSNENLFNFFKEYSEETSTQNNLKKEFSAVSQENKNTGKNTSGLCSSSTFSGKKPKTSSGEAVGNVNVKQEHLTESNNKKNNTEWMEIDNGLIGTIASVTGGASAFWESQYLNKQNENLNEYYNNEESYSKEEKNKPNQYLQSVDDKTCPNCESVFETEEEFELHTCCMIGSSTNLEEEDEDENGHFEDSISLGSEYDENESYFLEDQQLPSEEISAVRPIKITPWKCISCHLYFQSSLELRRHYSSISCLGKKTRALDCEFCYRQFLSFNDLLEHQVNHIIIKLDLTEDDLICCSQCSLQFPNERRFKNHLLVHTLKRKTPIKYTCSSCSQVFFQKDSYEKHLLTHVKMKSEKESVPEKPKEVAAVTYKPEAPENPSQTRSVNAPSEEEPKKPQRAIRCFRCGQMFGSVKQLEHHEAIKHKNPTPYICRKCCLRFSARSQLLMHLRVHMSKSNSKASSNAETVESATSCTICSAKFLLESDLESHMKTHKSNTSDPPSPSGPQSTPEENDNIDMFARYKCSLCSRLYVRASSCIRHGQQSHKGQKVIPLKLKRSVFLGRRTSLPAGGKVKHQCIKCPKYFFSFNAYSIHAYRNHGIKMQDSMDDPGSLETEDTPDSPKLDDIESKCPFCSKDIKPSYISLHIKKFHRGEVLDPSMIGKDIPNDSCICRYCLKTCSTPHNRKLHESIHYPVKAQKNQCETCGQKLSDRTLYEDHVRTCKSIRCGKCHKLFFKFVNLTQHSCAGNKSDEAHKCTVCLSAFTSLDLLQIHIKNFHGKKPESNIPQPGTSKNSAKRMEREIWREESNKIVCMVGEKFYCTFCDCEFSTIQESNEHRAVHPRGNWYAVQISDSLFQCTICDKFFETRKSSLLHINYHKKSLMPETPKSNYPVTFEPEVEIFTDVKTAAETPKIRKFNCRYCSAAFRDEESLQEHLFHTHVNQT